MHPSLRYMPASLVALLSLGAACASLAAGQQGIRLLGVPAGAHVYIDRARAEIAREVVPLAAGWHEIQVESLAGGQVVMCRRRAAVPPRRLVDISIAMRPVVAPGKKLCLPGLPGQVGIPAPPGPPMPRFDAQSDLELLKQILLDVVQYELSTQRDSAGRIAQAVGPQFYWYDPEGRTRLGPRGPQGRNGVVGRPTPSDAAYLLECEDRTGILQRLLEMLGVSELALRRDSVSKRAGHLPFTLPRRVESWRVTPLTPELRERLRQHRTAFPDEDGREAARGPQGMDGPIGCGLQVKRPPKVRLSGERTRQLLKMATQDPALQSLLRDTRLQIQDAELWVEEAEARERGE